MKKINERKIAVLLGKNIQKFREEQGISQSQLAFESEISLRQLGRIERGEINTTFFVLYKIGRAMNVSVIKFFEFLEE